MRIFYMSDLFVRTRMLLGDDAMEFLRGCRVAVFGLGGVGGYVVEALARSGIGALDLIDDDAVSQSNLNRQLLATADTLGRSKAEVAAERVSSINPDCRVTAHRVFFLPETRDLFDFRNYSYVVDAIDTVTGKLTIIEKAQQDGVPVISAMGTGNKLDPTALEVADLYETAVCPLCRVMRRECRKRGIGSLKVVYSRETPRRPYFPADPEEKDLITREEGLRGDKGRRDTPGSLVFVPAAAGILMAAEVVRDLLGL